MLLNKFIVDSEQTLHKLISLFDVHDVLVGTNITLYGTIDYVRRSSKNLTFVILKDGLQTLQYLIFTITNNEIEQTIDYNTQYPKRKKKRIPKFNPKFKKQANGSWLYNNR